jgi:hypothetical protein
LEFGFRSSRRYQSSRTFLSVKSTIGSRSLLIVAALIATGCANLGGKGIYEYQVEKLSANK